MALKRRDVGEKSSTSRNQEDINWSTEQLKNRPLINLTINKRANSVNRSTKLACSHKVPLGENFGFLFNPCHG